MKNKKIYAIAVLLLAIVLTLAFTAVTISAAEVTMDLSKAKVSEEYTLKDAEGNVFTAYYGLKADDNPFGYEIKPKQRDMHDYIAVSPTAPESKSEWIYGQDYLYCFCIEHGIPLPDKSNYSGSGETGYGNKYEQLSENQKTLLSLALAYGYPNRTDIETSKDANACYSATQLIVWQITLGFRSSATELDDKTFPMDGYTGTMTEQYTDNPYLKEYYDLILTDMTSHYMRPSFTGNVPATAPSYEMQYADGKYSITLTDTNQVLSNYKVSVNGGATVSINGNQLTISSAKPITNAIAIKLNRKMPKTTLTTGFLIWSVAGNEDRNQDMVSGVPANNDPVPAYLKVVSPTGSARIVKTSEDGKIEGIQFTITGNGIDKTVSTDENGEITISDLTPGIYTVTEHTDNVYEPQEPKTATIVSGQTTTVSFNNVLKLGHLVVIKTSEDGLTSGVLFRLYGTSESGMYVDKHVATDGSGKAFFTNIPIGSSYILEEVATKDFYITPIEQAVEIEWKKATTKTVTNALKKGELRVIKTAEDDMVEGVTFHLTGTSDSGAKVDLYAVTDTSGVAIFKDVLIGSNYTLSEENTEFKNITPVSQDTAIEWNHITEKIFYNELKRGDLTVTKTSEDGWVEGIIFRLYGTAECGRHVDVYATTDSSGKAYFKDVLIGSAYTLEECDVNEKYITPIAQTNVSVEWNRVSERAFYNELKRGSLTVTKTADDGLVSGITFRLYGTSLSGENVGLQATTNESGEATFLDVLIGSNYTLEEVATDSKYITPLEQTVVIQWAKVTFAEMHNALNHGELLIIKASEDGKVDGVRFTITGNGVNKTVMTDSNGEIKIQGLLPGTYTVTEQNEDYYEPQPTKPVTVVYNQTATVHFENILKRGDLTVTKTAEDGLTEGIRFRLTGTSDSGAKIDVTATVDSTGKAYFKDILIGSGYTLEEVNTNLKYIVPDSQNVEIEWNTVTSAHVHNTLKRGDLKVVKTSEDNFVESIKFRLYGTSLSGQTVDVVAYTDKDGVARFDDILIGEHYTVEEVDTAEHYIPPDSQTVVIEWNKVTQKDFHNELKRGNLKIIKTAEDNLVEGIKFRLYGTSLSGETVDVYSYTDKNGVAFFEDIPIGRNYTVEEMDTSLRYVVPEGQNIDINWNEITEVEIHNVLKKWRAAVFKIDRALSNEHVEIKDELLPRLFTLASHEQVNILGAPYGQTQGDATLEGAVYGVYKDGALIDTYTTDKNGYFITDYYPCYENVEWTIREISPSEGYLLDPTVYYIDTYAGQYTVELNTVYPNVYEDIIKGKITIIKHTDDGSTKIETPEVGAMFEVYLKSAGSYEAAETTERDILTCDVFGYAETIDLPYGVYVVRQIKGWEGRELLDPFEVFVSEDGEIYRYLINNRGFESYLHVVKTDSTTGKTIPYAGAGFQIYAPDGQLVTMSYTYPTLTMIDTFYTNEEGTLLTPEKLPYGEGYYLVEVQAPHGYVLDATPIYFDVTEENSADENGITIVKVVKANEPQKGTITITKTGEVFSSVA
ncbi:MAG: Cys-Gln thioester bond-forming surface protein, partial [Clostridia bacterium]|nr:Cys-Gln thioester bond-forming surface protein [Clostridia bacterium]